MLWLQNRVTQDVGKDCIPYAQKPPEPRGIVTGRARLSPRCTEHLSRNEDTRESVCFQIKSAVNMNEE